MLKADIPYFLTNKDWYYYDMDTGRYKLTNKAPQKAIDSYNKYYNLLENDIEKLLNDYFNLFPNGQLFPEWFDATKKDKIDMLKEAIKEKKDISDTKLFEEKYMEKVVFDNEKFKTFDNKNNNNNFK